MALSTYRVYSAFLSQCEYVALIIRILNYSVRMGVNTKSAIMRIGLVEMIRIAKMICPTVQDSTFFESCGIADVITTCFGGRNRLCAELFIKEKKVSGLFLVIEHASGPADTSLISPLNKLRRRYSTARNCRGL